MVTTFETERYLGRVHAQRAPWAVDDGCHFSGFWNFWVYGAYLP
jgi:hypothetical protein